MPALAHASAAGIVGCVGLRALSEGTIVKPESKIENAEIECNRQTVGSGGHENRVPELNHFDRLEYSCLARSRESQGCSCTEGPGTRAGAAAYIIAKAAGVVAIGTPNIGKHVLWHETVNPRQPVVTRTSIKAAPRRKLSGSCADSAWEELK
jgi:hypothetical protein